MMRDKLKDKMTEVSDYIFQHPELSKHEEQSSRALADFLEQEGFTVKWELAGFRTAFVAEWGSGSRSLVSLRSMMHFRGLHRSR